MKRRLVAGLLAAALSIPQAQAQGIPTYDNTLNLQQIKELAQIVKGYATQLQQLEQAAQQVQWATSTFNSLVANPNLANAMGLLNQLGISDPLPVSPYAIQGLISGQGGINGTLGALSTFANSAASTNHIYTPTDNTWASQQLTASANGIAGAQGIGQQVYSQLSARFPLLASLRQDMLNATTPAEREHVMGQIQAEQAWTANAQGQLQTAQLLLVAEHDNLEQRIDEHLTQSVDNQIAQAKAEGIIP